MRRTLTVLAGLAVLFAACASDDASVKDEAPLSLPTTPSPEPTVTPTPGVQERLPWGPSADDYERAADIVAGMPVERQAGQVIVAGYEGLEPPAELVSELGLGGVIVMTANVDSLEQIRAGNDELQRADDREYPVIVSIDQEGGTVARIRRPATEFPTYMSFGAARDPELATEVARASGDELRALGFTMVFAPGADVTVGPDDPTIGSRSASSDPQRVAGLVEASLAGYAEAGIIPVIKHFPGHGSVLADSHEELPTQSAELEELRQRDFVPFVAGIAAGTPAVMVAHIDVEAVDPGVPSSLSEEIVGLLRSDLDFGGLVVTDAQDMAAISESYDSGEAAVAALQAGADVVLMPLDVRAAHAGIVEAVEDGELPEERLEEAATRGVATMLYQAEADEEPGMDVVGDHGELSYRASLAAVTIAAGVCEGPYVGDSIEVVGGSEQDRDRLTEAAANAGLEVGSGDVVRLLGDAEPADGDVVVSLDTPYGLGGSTAGTAKIALYGRTPDAFRALVDVLRGEETGYGRLPVDVDGVDQLGCPSSN